MKFSKQLLYEFLNINLSLEKFSVYMTSAGIEVIGIKKIITCCDKIIIGKIQEIEIYHKDKNKCICKIQINNKKNIFILCYIYNVYINMKIPIVLAGEHLNGKIIKIEKINKKILHGLACSEKDLGFSNNYKKLISLPKTAQVGTSAIKHLHLKDEIIEIEVTSNRTDCMHIYGIARELAILTKTKLKPLKIKKQPITHNQYITSSINKKTDKCLYFLSRIIKNINAITSTPLLIQERLRRSDIKLDSIIDNITNYVFLIFGQKIHAFDADKIKGNICVRYAKTGENIKLSKKLINLKANTLIITDDIKIIAIAGIINNSDTCIQNNTKNIILSSVHIDTHTIIKTSQEYNISNIYNHYETTSNYKISKYSIEYATQLIIEHAKGSAGRIYYICKDKNYIHKKLIHLNLKNINYVVGIYFTPNFVEQALTRLNVTFEKKDINQWIVTPPAYRKDINIENDLIEEITKIYGFKNLPYTLPTIKMHSETFKNNVQDKILTLKNILKYQGYNEVINYSFINKKFDNIFFSNPSINIKNPISKNITLLRQSLIPGLLLNHKYNINRKINRIRIFEQGTCFFTSPKLKYKEHCHIGGCIYGNLLPIQARTNLKSNFYTVKSDVESILKKYSNINFQLCKDIKWLNPDQSAYIYQNNTKIGIIGIIQENILALLNIKSHAPIVFEIYYNKLYYKNIQTQYNQISKINPIYRDINIVVNKDINAQTIITNINNNKINFLKNIEIFDVYYNEELPQDKKSVSIRLTFQSITETLEEKTISKIIETILKSLKHTIKATLRMKK